MAQGSSMDMSRLSTADKIVLGAAGLFFIWVFLPFWYSCCSLLGFTSNLGSVNGFRGVIILSWLLSIVAIAEIVTSRMLGMNFNLPAKRGLIHLVVAGVALLFVLLGLVSKSTGLTLGWGIFVAIVIALVWAYGAYMMYSEPETAPMAPPPADTPGFTS